MMMKLPIWALAKLLPKVSETRRCHLLHSLFFADTISNLIQELKSSLETEQTPRPFDTENVDLFFNCPSQTLVYQQQLEFINGCPFVFPGNMDFAVEENSIFSVDTIDN